MAEKPWDWITDDDLADALEVTATLIGIRDQHKSSESREAWARFNKQADAMQLAHYIDRQKEEAEFDRRTAALHDREAATARFEVDMLRTEQEAIRERMRVHDAFYEPEVAAAYRQKAATLRAGIAEIETRVGTLGTRGRLVELQATSAERLAAARLGVVDLREATAGRLAAARMGTLDAKTRELMVEATTGQATLAARGGMVAAGMRALEAEEEELATTTAIRGRQRLRQMEEEIGSAVVGAAARGVTGSIEGTAAAVARQRAGEDLAVLGAQATTQRALLGRRSAELVHDATRITAERALGAAARAVRGGTIDEARIRTQAEARETGLRAGVERIELGTARAEAGLRADVRRAELAGEAGVLGLRREAGAEALSQAALARDRERAEGRLQRVALAGEGARAALAERRAGTAADRVALAGDKARSEARAADISSTLAKWSLEHVPELPDYEGARFRSTIGGLLGLGASMIDDD